MRKEVALLTSFLMFMAVPFSAHSKSIGLSMKSGSEQKD